MIPPSDTIAIPETPPTLHRQALRTTATQHHFLSTSRSLRGSPEPFTAPVDCWPTMVQPLRSPLAAPSSASFAGAPLTDVANRPPPQSVQNASSQMFSAIGGAAPAPASSAASAALALGPPLQQESNRPPTQNIPFGGGSGGAPGGPPIPPGAGALQQGQQPILNVSCR